MSATSPLFEPFTLNATLLANRWVMPAMQRGKCENGVPLPELATYYRQRAEGGVSLIIGESAAIDHPSATVQKGAAWLNRASRDGWARCVDAVQSAGSYMLLQLWHEGAIRNDGNAVSPSGLAFPGKQNGRAATLGELAEIRDGFVRSALIAKEIGATGIEVHAAHGYCLDQFLWHGTNIRTDGYGGPDIADRARFPAEIVAAIRQACGPAFVITLRMSQWKEANYAARIAETPEELERLVTILSEAGVDALHCSNRRFWENEWDGDRRNLAGWSKALSGLPAITVGSVGLDTDIMTTIMEKTDPGARVAEAIEELEVRVAAGEFDLVAVGRALIADPDFVRKVEQRDYAAIRTFKRSDLVLGEWDLAVVHEAHETGQAAH